MKTRTLIPILFAAAVLLSGCAQPKTLNGKTYQPYGLFNEQAIKSDDVTYQASAGSVIVGILCMETVVVPVYVVGWNLYEPVAAKPRPCPAKP